MLGILFDVARGALPDLAGPATRLERWAEEHGFESFHWLDLLGAVVGRLPEDAGAGKMAMADALNRLDLVVGSRSRLARERRTDAPPSAVL